MVAGPHLGEQVVERLRRARRRPPVGRAPRWWRPWPRRRRAGRTGCTPRAAPTSAMASSQSSDLRAEAARARRRQPTTRVAGVGQRVERASIGDLRRRRAGRRRRPSGGADRLADDRARRRCRPCRVDSATSCSSHRPNVVDARGRGRSVSLSRPARTPPAIAAASRSAGLRAGSTSGPHAASASRPPCEQRGRRRRRRAGAGTMPNSDSAE